MPPSDRDSTASRSPRHPVLGRVAAIDIGSNSVRIAVVDVCADLLHVIEEESATPRLIRDVETTGRLSDRTIEHVLGIVADFTAIARAQAATSIIAVATSAVRDAANGDELVARAREELGVDASIIDGYEEAQLACRGAVHDLPVEHGFMLDVGGGSLEVVRFRDRQPVQSWTLPLGAVRLTDQFLKSDPPSPGELDALRAFVAEQIEAANIPPIVRGDVLVGTGGTIRNVAKMERARKRYPLARLHGYTVGARELRRLVDTLSKRTLAERRTLPGLNEDRADTIVAGAIAVQAIVDATRAPSMVVSGQGLREGVALRAGGGELPTLARVRRAALEDAVDRFVPELRASADRRRGRITALAGLAGVDPDSDIGRTLAAAAYVIDVGRSVDYYNRHRHTEALLLTRGLAGWSHREIALICALVRQADREEYSPTAYRPLIAGGERGSIAAAAALLALADEVERRLPAGIDDDWRLDGEQLVCGGTGLGSALLAGLGERLARTTGLRLRAA